MTVGVFIINKTKTFSLRRTIFREILKIKFFTKTSFKTSYR